MSYFRVKQVAERLQVSVATVYQLCAEGRIKHHRLGLGRGTIRITVEQLRQYLEETEREALRRCDPPDGRCWKPVSPACWSA
jgi:excisionase family DNA binding protein